MFLNLAGVFTDDSSNGLQLQNAKLCHAHIVRTNIFPINFPEAG